MLTSATPVCPFQFRASDAKIGLFWLAKVCFRLISASNYRLACHDRRTSIFVVGQGHRNVGRIACERVFSEFQLSREISSSSCETFQNLLHS